MASATGMTVPPFLSKIYDMVDDPSSNSVVSWSSSDSSFVVWNVPEFQSKLLPKFFKHNNFSSFVRQLNTYGFRKIDPDHFEIANEGFLRGQKHLLKGIIRKKPAHVHNNQSTQAQSSSVASCVDIGKNGLEEEVERLKQDKNVLMQDLVRLKQQQQSTDNQLQSEGQRVHLMEQRQQQMMSFLAKAMQNPGFLNQFIQKPNESSRLISGTSKKRRLPGHEEENMASMNSSNSPNGKMIKFHSSINEAEKAILQQLLKMNSSPRLQPSVQNSSTFLLENLPSPGALDNSGFSSWSSTLMLSEVQPTPEPSPVPVEPGPGFPAEHLSIDISEARSPLFHLIEDGNTSKLDTINSAQAKFTEMQGTLPESPTGIPEVSAAPETGSTDCFAPTSSAFNATETDSIYSDQDVGISANDIAKLPGINDVFWEQFLTTSPITGYIDEIDSSSLESSMTKDQEVQSCQDNGWDKVQNMNCLAEQMELLSSESQRM